MLEVGLGSSSGRDVDRKERREGIGEAVPRWEELENYRLHFCSVMCGPRVNSGLIATLVQCMIHSNESIIIGVPYKRKGVVHSAITLVRLI